MSKAPILSLFIFEIFARFVRRRYSGNLALSNTAPGGMALSNTVTGNTAPSNTAPGNTVFLRISNNQGVELKYFNY